MPESLVVIGNVDFISAETFSTENVLKSIEQGNHVLLIEGYGVLVLGKSAIQVCFMHPIVELSDEEIKEVFSVFGGSLIPK